MASDDDFAPEDLDDGMDEPDLDFEPDHLLHHRPRRHLRRTDLVLHAAALAAVGPAREARRRP
jgi:hypothetical protein